MGTHRYLAAAGAAVLILALAAPAPASGDGGLTGLRLDLDVLSSRPAQVSGGDALVRVSLGSRVDPDDVRVTLNGVDVTSSLTPAPDGRSLSGVIAGMRLGLNLVLARAQHGPGDALVLRNHPIAGPIFS